MCSEFTIKAKKADIERELEIEVKNLTDDDPWDKRIKLTSKAPIIYRESTGEIILDNYIFPLKPQWNSRLSGDDKFDTENIRRIYDLKSWKQPFEKTPCLVPMSSFIEPVYWGEQVGTAQAFSLESTPFFVAGLRIHATMPLTDRAFSLITHTPTKQMLEYHRRLLVILPTKKALEWLEPMEKTDRFSFLLENRVTSDLIVSKDRNLSPSTIKKNTTERLEERQEELRYMAKLKAEGVEG